MELQNSNKKLGEYIHKNMDLDTMKDKLLSIKQKKPELSTILDGFLDKITALGSVLKVNTELFSKVETMRDNLKKLKSTLNLAQKSYNIGNKTSSVLLDTKPTINGQPLATGTSIALSPLESEVSKTIDSIDSLEKQIDSESEKLNKQSEENINKVKELTSSIVSKLLT